MPICPIGGTTHRGAIDVSHETYAPHDNMPECLENDQIFSGYYGGYLGNGFGMSSGYRGEFLGFVPNCPNLIEGFWNQNRPRPLHTAGWVGSVKGSQLAAPRFRFVMPHNAHCHDTMPRTPRTLSRNARALS